MVENNSTQDQNQEDLTRQEELTSKPDDFKYTIWSLQQLINVERKPRKNKKIVIVLTGTLNPFL